MCNIDEIIEDQCKIAKPKYTERARALCMDFFYFDKHVEVFSEETVTRKTKQVAVMSSKSISKTSEEEKEDVALQNGKKPPEP